VALIAKLTVARTNFRDSQLDESVLVELQQDAAHILNDLRNLAQGIHPTILTDGGLVEAVEDRCKRLPMDAVVDVPPELRGERFDDDTEGAAYFFVAEGLTNVLKHADATGTRVGVRRSNGRIELEVRDNGIGFDTTANHLKGLTGLSDRFRALGGGISVHSDPGNGTVLKGHLPLEQS
jgi:signal transduction histidine kinase